MDPHRAGAAHLEGLVASAIAVEDSARVALHPSISVPPGGVALDGIEVAVAVAVVPSDPGPVASPELVVELSAAVERPNLHRLAWRSLRVGEVWTVDTAGGWVQIWRPVSGEPPWRLRKGDRLVSEGRGWTADFAVDEVLVTYG